jgi:hypothetical protein
MGEEKYIGKAKMKEQPSKPFSFKLKDKSVKNNHLDDSSVDTRVLKNKAVTPEKLSDDVQGSIVGPIDNKYKTITDSLDQKYANITEELYSMIRSLQVGGVALSTQFGDREDIGITQKTLTKMFGALWDTIAQYHPGHNYFDFTLTVNPLYIFNEIEEDSVRVIADCSQAISDFDSVKVYVNDELRAESSDIKIFDTTVTITETSTIKVVGTILGRPITKTATVVNEIPFFMGGGQNYQDIMKEEYRKTLEGTLEGDYDLIVKQDGQHMFIIIPASRQSEFRRAMLVPDYDMNGFEIPLDKVYENQDYVVYKSKAEHGYLAGTYNIDININS